MSATKYTHLHLHTQYSLLDGSGKIPEMIAQAKALGMDSIAITDHGVMYGVVDFYEEALKQEIWDFMMFQFEDNTKARIYDSSLQNKYQTNTLTKSRAQTRFYEYLKYEE